MTATLDLLVTPLDQLVEEGDPESLLAAATSLQEWKGRASRVLDKTYQTIYAQLLRSHASADELARWSEHLARVIAHHERTAHAKEAAFRDRWNAFRDLIETRISILRAPTPHRLLDQTRLSEIVSYVLVQNRQGKNVSQRDIHQLFLRATGSANVTRVLNFLESLELIERRRIGRENIVATGMKALQHQQKFAVADAATILKNAGSQRISVPTTISTTYNRESNSMIIVADAQRPVLKPSVRTHAN